MRIVSLSRFRMVNIGRRTLVNPRRRFTVWLCHRFDLSHRDIEDLLAEQGIEVSYESVRLWRNEVGPLFSKRLKRKHPGSGDTFFLDEVFVTIAGQRHSG